MTSASPAPPISSCPSTAPSFSSTAASGTATAVAPSLEPKTNAGFWKEKIARNIARDELNAQRLDTLAWTVITVWECELGKKILDATIARIEADLQAATTKYEHYLCIRRENREFARKQARKHREILA